MNRQQIERLLYIAVSTPSTRLCLKFKAEFVRDSRMSIAKFNDIEGENSQYLVVNEGRTPEDRLAAAIFFREIGPGEFIIEPFSYMNVRAFLDFFAGKLESVELIEPQ